MQWGAQWIDVSKEIVSAFNETHPTRIAWELHSGGSAAIVAKTAPAAPAAGPEAGKSPSRGYQATEHVNNYYRTAKV